MAIFYLPRIAEADFDTVRRLLDLCPADSYAAWLVFQTKEIAAIRADAHAVKMVAVEPQSFARYCAAAGGRCDIETLRAFVFEQATGKPY